MIKGFGKVTVFEHNNNLGPVGNSEYLLKYVLDKYDAYIYSEDDNVFSPCFLDYMDKCLEKYRDDQEILLVCGCLVPDVKRILDKGISKMKGNVIKVLGNANAYGCGLWKDKENYLRNNFPVDIRKYIFSSRKNILKLLKAPGKLNHIYFWIEKKPELNRICDFTRNAWMVLNKKSNIFPNISLVRNNGFDGTGVNCGSSEEIEKEWNELIISKEKEFIVNDSISKKDVDKYSKILFNDVSNKEKKDIYPIIILHLIFGYPFLQWAKGKYLRLKNKLKFIISSWNL